MEPREIRTNRHAVAGAVRATLPGTSRSRRRRDGKPLEARLGRAIPAPAAASRRPWPDRPSESACSRHRHSDTSLNRGVETHGPHIIREALTTLRTWHRRARTRRHLLDLDDHLLADVGLDRADAAREVAKPFWRP